MRRIHEDRAVLQVIEQTTGAPGDRVATVVAALRDAIDGLFLDGYTIFAPPFSLTYKTDPVAPIFAERLEGASSAEIEAWNLGDMEATAKWLDVPLAVYMRHPVASDLRVLIDLLEALDIEDADSPEGTEVLAIAEAWFDTFRQERTYRLSHVGLERDLEAWLIHHTERLDEIGYDVSLRNQQFVLPDRRRPDLVFDLTESDGAPGTLIVELKATGGYLEAVDQLVGYMDAFRSLGLANGVLRGLLVADGYPHDVLLYADEKGIDTATLTELGYRRDLAQQPTTGRISQPVESGSTEDKAMHPQDQPALRWVKIHHVQADWIHLVAAEHPGGTHWDFEVLDEDVSDPDGDFLVYVSEKSGEDLRISIRCDPLRADRPVRLHAAFREMLFGSPTLHWGDIRRSIWWSDGSPWITDRPTTWEEAADDGFPYLPGQIDDRRHAPDPPETHSQPSEDLISADEVLIPQWEEAYEINVHAMQAATDFLQAAGEIRKNLTYVPPRGLADWLSQTSEKLRGDYELPEHIRAATDALEGLPAVILGDKVPSNYDGHAGEFLRDAERILTSVAKRLRRIGPPQSLDQA